MGLDIYFYRRKNSNARIERAFETFWDKFNENMLVSEVRALAEELGIADRLTVEEGEYEGEPFVDASRNDTEKVGYMRKHNHLLPYFKYGDDCSDKPVTRVAMEAFVDDAKEVLSRYGEDGFQEVAERLIPHEEGFFFGSCEYDEQYKRDLKEDIRIFQKILEATDWNSDIVVMHCWW